MPYIGAPAAPQIASLAPGSVETSDIQNGAVTQAKLDPSISLGVRVSSVAYPGDDTAADPAGGQTITITGAGFAATPTVYIDNTIAPSVSFVSSTQITFTTPAKTAGTYNLFVINPDGSTAIHVMGISYSGTPAWTTPAGSLGSQNAAAISVQLIATGDTPLVYSLTSGSTLPAGVTLSSSGLISGSLGTAQTFSFSVDVTDPQYQTTPRSFSLTVTIGEAYFQYVTLLLHGNQPSGVTDTNNNVFKDSSANNFTITRNPASGPNAPTQGTFTPFSKPDGRWSNYFDGSSYITSSSTTAFNSFITGSATGITFTIEAFVFPTVTVNGANPWQGAPIFVKGQTYLNFHVQNDKLRLYWYDQGGVARYVESTASVPLNQWTQVGATVNGSAVTMYINGVASGTGTFNGINTGGVNGAELVGYQAAAGNTSSYYGYISNLRVSNIVRTITAATSPFTSDANTIYLTCRNNRFVDASSNGYTFTVTGSGASVQTFSPFPTLVAYSAGTNGGSGYFDATGDTLSAGSNAAFALGTGDFTVETFAYYVAQSNIDAIAVANWDGVTWGSNKWSLHLDHTTARFKVTFWFHNYSSSAPLLTSSITLAVGQWYHVAVSRSGNTFRLFINGVLDVSATNSTSLDGGNNSPIYVGGGGGGGGSQYFNGYLSSTRLVKGTAVYTATFTTPTAPLTAVSGTSLLLNFTNGAIIDNAMFNDLETVGGAAISTTQSKWGGGSIYFDGSGDKLLIPDSQNFNYGSGNFTVECWVYPTANASFAGIFTKRASGAVYAPIQVLINSGTMALFVSTSGSAWAINANASSSPSLNVWSHIAAVRNGATITLYLNGTSVASGSVSTSALMTNTAQFVLGAEGANDTGNYAGYIDDFRITKGYARYTANFTPPTGPFEDNGV